jgi:molecular chaperone DnaK (HSP70)
MDIEDKELFESATNDEPIEVTADEPVAEPVNDGPARDEQGRFAPKEPEPVVAEVEPKPEGKDEAYVPSWRLREMREEREAVERRFQETQQHWQRQIAELQAKLPKAEPARVPDVFEDPNGFLQHGVQQAIDPISQQMGKLTEFFSRKDAIREHGEEKVNAAYTALDRAANAGDPEAQAVVSRVKKSMDPYGDMVSWHSKQSVFQQIGNDPNAWFEKELEKRLADPQFASAQLQRIQSGVRSPGTQTPNQIRLPPSIGRVPSSQSASEDAPDMSDAGLFAHATR